MGYGSKMRFLSPVHAGVVQHQTFVFSSLNHIKYWIIHLANLVLVFEDLTPFLLLYLVGLQPQWHTLKRLEQRVPLSLDIRIRESYIQTHVHTLTIVCVIKVRLSISRTYQSLVGNGRAYTTGFLIYLPVVAEDDFLFLLVDMLWAVEQLFGF